ncbi:MAG: selenide, water dikinase SelD [Deltaproteobacteria bacterium]|jgi:selenide, water dikinase|nr:selenide, water dikinase SelD [Deltaproteobacteria bacterium]
MDLSDALKDIKPSHDENLLVGFENSDDASVYRLSDEIAMVNTIDFITPPVDDPYWFGLIAAANSLSDIYAMGGKPLTALNVVMFPGKKLDSGILREILRGGADKVRESGACIVGGHSVDDNEPKYGLSVSGIVHPDKILTNSRAKAGDALILTKPIGSGVLLNAVRDGKYPFNELEKQVLPKMATLNKKAIECALPFDIQACTDVTGFGLVGHALEMARGSQKQIVIYYDKVPFYPDAYEMYQKGVSTGSNKDNKALVEKYLDIQKTIDNQQESLLYDPQTSGGLLLSISKSHLESVLSAINSQCDIQATYIGEVFDGNSEVIIA